MGKPKFVSVNTILGYNLFQDEIKAVQIVRVLKEEAASNLNRLIDRQIFMPDRGDKKLMEELVRTKTRERITYVFENGPRLKIGNQEALRKENSVGGVKKTPRRRKFEKLHDVSMG